MASVSISDLTLLCGRSVVAPSWTERRTVRTRHCGHGGRTATRRGPEIRQPRRVALRQAREERPLPLGSARGQRSGIGGASVGAEAMGRHWPPRATSIPGARCSPIARCWPRRGRSAPPASARHAPRPIAGHQVAGAAPGSGTGWLRWSGIAAERPPRAGREGAPGEALWFTGTAERIPLDPFGVVRCQSAVTTRPPADRACVAPVVRASTSASCTMLDSGICQPQISGRTRQWTTPCCSGVGGSGT